MTYFEILIVGAVWLILRAWNEAVKHASAIKIKTKEEVARTLRERRLADRGFLPNTLLLTIYALVIICLFYYPRAILLLIGLVAFDFAVFVVRRRRILQASRRGTPQLETMEDFAAASRAFESAGSPEPTMSDYERAARASAHPNWRVDLRYEKLVAMCRSGEVVADVGCGDGRLCWKYKICPPDRYIGVDVGEGLIEMLRQKTDGKATVIIGVAERTGLPDNSVDVLVCAECFEHLPWPDLAMKEFSRVVCPGGRIIITSPSATRIRNMNVFHILTTFMGRLFPAVLQRTVVHPNTFVHAYTYHWDFTEQDFRRYIQGLPLRIESIATAVYRFNPKGNSLHRIAYRSAECLRWAWWDLTVVLRKV